MGKSSKRGEMGQRPWRESAARVRAASRGGSRLPLPFHYLSTGVVTQFVNGLDPEPRSRSVFTFDRPEELLRLVSEGEQLRQRLRHLPQLISGKLWPVQVEVNFTTPSRMSAFPDEVFQHRIAVGEIVAGAEIDLGLRSLVAPCALARGVADVMRTIEATTAW